MADLPHTALTLLATLAWVVAGAPKLSFLWGRPSWTLADLAWLVVYLGFGTALFAARFSRRPLRFVILQSLCAFLILLLGMPHFEGALFAIVAAQFGLVVGPGVAVLWIFAQAVPLAIVIWPSHEWDGTFKATLEYVGFSLFSMTTVLLFEREKRARQDLGAINGELLRTRAMFERAIRASEQDRIRQELHDGLGHALVTLRATIEAAERANVTRLDSGELSEVLTTARPLMDAVDQVADAARAALTRSVQIVDLHEAITRMSTQVPGVQVACDLEALPSFGPHGSWVIYRAIEESMTNAVKHGRASTVTIHAIKEGDTLRLEVANDGHRDHRPVVFGAGLSGMADRVRTLGASLMVQTDPVFKVVLALPLSATPLRNSIAPFSNDSVTAGAT